MGYLILRESNPSLVYLPMPGFAPGDPNEAGYDEAATGKLLEAEVLRKGWPGLNRYVGAEFEPTRFTMRTGPAERDRENRLSPPGLGATPVPRN